MSKGICCKDKSHRPFWRVMQRWCNHSAFNGYRYTPSAWSAVICTAPGCPSFWRTKAAYVNELPDHDGEERE